MADSTCTGSVRVRESERRESSACPDVIAQNAGRMRVGARPCLLPRLVSPFSAVLLSWAHVSPAIRCSISCLTVLSQTRWLPPSRGSSTSKPPLSGISGRQLALYKEKALTRMQMFESWESGAYVPACPMLRSLPDEEGTACRYRSAPAVSAAARLPIPARVCCVATVCYTSCIFVARLLSRPPARSSL